MTVRGSNPTRRSLIRCAMMVPCFAGMISLADAQGCPNCSGRKVTIEFDYEEAAKTVLSMEGDAEDGHHESEIRIKPKLKPEKEYSFSVDLVDKGIGGGSANDKIVFGCGLEYRAHYIDLDPDDNVSPPPSVWVKGCVPLKVGMKNVSESPNPPDWRIDVASFDVRFTEEEDNESGDKDNGVTPGGGASQADFTSTTPSYSQDAANGTLTLASPQIGIEIPLGKIGMGSGGTAPYRSAGRLVSTGSVSASRSAPTSFEYLGIEEVKGKPASGGNPEILALVTYEDYTAGTGAPLEKVLVTPTRVFRVSGYNGTVSGTVVPFGQAENTLVREYSRGPNETVTQALAGAFVASWKISSSGSAVTVVESAGGESKTTTYQSSQSDVLVSTEGLMSTTVIVGGKDDEAGTFEEVTTVTRNNVAISKTRTTYQFIGGEAKPVLVEQFADPDAAQTDLVTEYDYYDADDATKRIAKGDMRWTVRPDGGWTYYQRASNGVTVYEPFASETYIDKSIHDDGAFPVVPSVGSPQTGGSGRVRAMEDNSEFVINYEYWDEELFDYPSPSSNPANVVLLEWERTIVSSQPASSDEYTDTGLFLLQGYPKDNVGQLNEHFEISHSYQLSGDDRWKAGEPLLFVRDFGVGTLFSCEKTGLSIVKTATTGRVSTESSEGAVEIAGQGIYFSAVPGISTQTVSTYGPEGLVSTAYWFHTGSGFSRAYTDEVHRGEGFEYTTREGVEIARIEETAPGTVVETDETGRKTTTVSNEMGEVLSVTVEAGGGVSAQTTTITINGRTTTTALNGVTTSVTTVDGLGRVDSQVDASGAVTNYDYPDGGRRTETSRNGVTRESENYLDGRPKSIGGSGVINEYFTYDAGDWVTLSVESTTHSLGSDTGHTARSTIQGFDSEGRREVVLRPSPAPGEGTIKERYLYHPRQKHLLGVESYAHADDEEPQTIQLMVGNTSADPTIQEIMGAESLSGQDVDGSQTLAFGTPDRFSRRSWSYILDGNVVYRQSQQFRYPDGTEANKETTTQLQSVGFIASVNGFSEISKTIFPSGRTTTVTRNVDPAAKTEVTIEDDSATAAVDSTATTVNGYLQSVVRAGAAAGKSESYSYDSFGRVEHYTDIRGASTWSIYYNSGFQIEKVRNQLNEETRYDYYPSGHRNAGLLWKVTQPGGRVVETAYNDRGEVTSTTGNGTYPISFSFDPYGQRETMTTYRGDDMTNPVVTRWTYSPGRGVLTHKRYNSPTATSGSGIQYEYTWDGKLAERQTTGGVETSYTYDPDTRDLTDVDYSGEGDRTPDLDFRNFDHFGRPGKVEETLLAVAGVNGAESRTQTLSYQPHSGAISTTYWANHPWLPDMAIIQRADDALGRPAGFDVNKSNAVQTSQGYGYDFLGRLDTVTSADFTAGHEYLPGTDTPYRVTVRDATTQQKDVALERTRSIDLLGRVLGTINKAPGSGLGSSLVTISSVGHQYDSSGRRDDARREDGTWWDYSYNERSEVTGAIKKTSGNASVPGQSYGYDYDGIGNRKTATYGAGSNISTIGYTRNDLNQYTNITRPGTFDLLVRASGAVTASATAGTSVESIVSEGNLYGLRMNSSANSSTGQSSTTTIALQSNPGQTSTINRWVPKASEARSYDLDGNLTEDSRWSYTWDGENRLVKLTPKTGAPNVTLWYSYDYRGRRIARKVADARSGTTTTTLTAFVYDDWNPVAEWDAVATGASTPTTAGYVLRRTQLWGLDLGGGGATPYGGGGFQAAGGVGGLLAVTYHDTTKRHYLPGYDANGNIISWSTGTGDLLQRMDYDPFGNRIFEEKLSSDGTLLATVPSYGFSTKPRDPGSDLLYYGYRHYEPATGRWPSRDPIEERGGANLYGFVGNDGSNRWDVLGLDFIAVGKTKVSSWNGWVPLGQHAIAQIWESDCPLEDDELNKWTTKKDLFERLKSRGGKKLSLRRSVEVGPQDSYKSTATWTASAYIPEMGGVVTNTLKREFPDLWISVVFYGQKEGDQFAPVFSSNDGWKVQMKWQRMIDAERDYKYAEESKGELNHFPHSIYGRPDYVSQMPFASSPIPFNNSNTFVRHILNQAGIDWRIVNGDFPGNWYPEDVRGTWTTPIAN